MSRGRRRGGKNRGKQNKPNSPAQGEQGAKKAGADIPKGKNGIFNFTDEELAADDSIRLIGQSENTDNKYASFDDYLKDH